jgi:hypothetical protein
LACAIKDGKLPAGVFITVVPTRKLTITILVASILHSEAHGFIVCAKHD